MGRGAREPVPEAAGGSRAWRTPEREMPDSAHRRVITSTHAHRPWCCRDPRPRQNGENHLQQQRCLAWGFQRPQVLVPGAGVTRALGSGLGAAGGPNSPSLRAGARPPGVPGTRRALPPGPAPRASSPAPALHRPGCTLHPALTGIGRAAAAGRAGAWGSAPPRACLSVPLPYLARRRERARRLRGGSRAAARSGRAWSPTKAARARRPPRARGPGPAAPSH